MAIWYKVRRSEGQKTWCKMFYYCQKSWIYPGHLLLTIYGKGRLRRAATFLTLSQRATIYEAMICSKIEYASSVWIGALTTSLFKVDAFQKRAMQTIIGVSEDNRNSTKTSSRVGEELWKPPLYLTECFAVKLQNSCSICFLAERK